MSRVLDFFLFILYHMEDQKERNVIYLRRLLSLALALMLLLCACGKTAENTSSLPGTESVEESSAEESEVSKVFEENQLIGEIDTYLTGEAPDRTMLAKNLFAEASYTFNTNTNESYTDPDMKKLNDGNKRDLFDQYSWVGFTGNTVPTVTFDLGEGEHALADVEINMLRQVAYGIELPDSVILSVSRDGKEFVDISTLKSPADVGEGNVFVYRFALPVTVSARYIRLTFRRKASNFLFMDEITGYEYCEEGTIDPSTGSSTADVEKVFDYYEYRLNTEVTTPVSPSDSDYDTRQNLALLEGVEVQAKHFDPFEPAHTASNTNKAGLAKLIDGEKAAKAAYSDPAFAHFYRGCGRHIVVDLGNEMAVDSVEAEFLNKVSVGIAVPPAVMVSVSNDGESWITTYGGSTMEYGSKEECLHTVSAVFKETYRARYIRISFTTVPENTTSSNVYLSEIQVFGKKNAENVPEAKDDPSIVMGRYPDIEDLGCNNVLLAAVNGNAKENPTRNLDVAGALKHQAYLDEQGNVLDTFYDSVLFCPSNSFPFTSDVKANADLYRADMFTEGFNLYAWDEAARQVQEAIPGTANATVWLNLMCPDNDDTCPDVDGDGKAEDLSTPEGRLSYLKYQVDEYLKAWEEAGFEHITLLGFYWNNETIHKQDLAMEKAVIGGINAYIHEKGYKSFWCPYYSAYGTWLWQELGFDVACLQPNYMFYVTEPTRLKATADIAKIYGMCVEIEIEVVSGEGSVGKYREYLREGFDSGYMHSVKLYYVSGTPSAIAAAYDSEDPLAHSVYEDTYLYAKEKLDESYNKGASVSMDGVKDLTLQVVHGKRVDFDLALPEGVKARIMESTVYGTFRLDLSGKGYYRAMKGFRGEDKVILEIYDTAGNRKTVTIAVTVTEE